MDDNQAHEFANRYKASISFLLNRKKSPFSYVLYLGSLLRPRHI